MEEETGAPPPVHTQPPATNPFLTRTPAQVVLLSFSRLLWWRGLCPAWDGAQSPFPPHEATSAQPRPLGHTLHAESEHVFVKNFSSSSTTNLLVLPFSAGARPDRLPTPDHCPRPPHRSNSTIEQIFAEGRSHGTAPETESSGSPGGAPPKLSFRCKRR